LPFPSVVPPLHARPTASQRGEETGERGLMAARLRRAAIKPLILSPFPRRERLGKAITLIRRGKGAGGIGDTAAEFAMALASPSAIIDKKALLM